MHPRLRLVLIGVAACSLAVIAGTLVAAYQSAGDLQRDETYGWEGALRPPGAAVPGFELSDQEGRTVSSAQLRGEGPVIYTFVYSTCEETCPIQVQQIRGALDDLGKDVPVIGVSVDPANDTPQRARRFVLEQHMTGRMHFLLGSRAELRPVWKAFGIAPQSHELEHSAYVVVADERGDQRIGFPASQLTSSRLAADLRRLGA